MPSFEIPFFIQLFYLVCIRCNRVGEIRKSPIEGFAFLKPRSIHIQSEIAIYRVWMDPRRWRWRHRFYVP
jgi:hypothetical protein